MVSKFKQALDKAFTDAIDQDGCFENADGIRYKLFSADTFRTIKEALAIADRMKWRPIEEAPRDGDTVLLRNSEKTIFSGSYQNGGEEEQSFWLVTSELLAFYEPTHWMPLPPSPNEGDVE